MFVYVCVVIGKIIRNGRKEREISQQNTLTLTHSTKICICIVCVRIYVLLAANINKLTDN